LRRSVHSTDRAARRYYVKDHLGSIRAVVDSEAPGTGAQKVVETRDDYPFGLRMPGRSVTTGTPAVEDYTGHELDGETGMHYAGARYYMSALGRWTSVDPLANKNYRDSPYAYVVNNPMNYLDPTGRDTTGPGNRRLSQEEVIGYWTQLSNAGMNSIKGGLKAVEASRALNSLTKAGSGAAVVLTGLDIYLDPTRENVVTESSKLGGALFGGKAGIAACGFLAGGSGGTGVVSCVILVPADAVIGGAAGEKLVGDTINEWFGDYIDSALRIRLSPDDPSEESPDRSDDESDDGSDADTNDRQPDSPEDED